MEKSVPVTFAGREFNRNAESGTVCAAFFILRQMQKVLAFRGFLLYDIHIIGIA